MSSFKRLQDATTEELIQWARSIFPETAANVDSLMNHWQAQGMTSRHPDSSLKLKDVKAIAGFSFVGIEEQDWNELIPYMNLRGFIKRKIISGLDANVLATTTNNATRATEISKGEAQLRPFQIVDSTQSPSAPDSPEKSQTAGAIMDIAAGQNTMGECSDQADSQFPPTTVIRTTPTRADQRSFDYDLECMIGAPPTTGQLKLWEAIQSGQNILFLAGTGSGKSTLLLKLASAMQSNPSNTYRMLLIHPLSTALDDFYKTLDADFRTKYVTMLWGKVQKVQAQGILILATPESLRIRYKRDIAPHLDKWDTITIFDECDEICALAETYRNTADDLIKMIAHRSSIKKTQVILMSATCSRSSMEHMDSKSVVQELRLNLVKVDPLGYKSRTTLVNHWMKVDVKNGETVLEARARTTVEAITTLKQKALVYVRQMHSQTNDKQVIAPLVQHLEAKFNSLGISYELLHSNVENRSQLISAFNQNQVEVLVSTKLTERIPGILTDHVILAEPAETTAGDEQQAGRAGRQRIGDRPPSIGHVTRIVYETDPHQYFGRFLQSNGSCSGASANGMRAMLEILRSEECRIKAMHFEATGESIPQCGVCPNCERMAADFETLDAEWLKHAYEAVIDAAEETSTTENLFPNARALSGYLVGSPNAMTAAQAAIGRERMKAFGRLQKRITESNVEKLIRIMRDADFLAFDERTKQYLVAAKGRSWREDGDRLPVFRSNVKATIQGLQPAAPVHVDANDDHEIGVTKTTRISGDVEQAIENAALVEVQPNQYGDHYDLCHPKYGSLYIVRLEEEHIMIRKDVTSAFQFATDKNPISATETDKIIDSLSAQNQLVLSSEATAAVHRCRGVKSCSKCAAIYPSNAQRGCVKQDHPGEELSHKECTARIVIVKDGDTVVIIPLGEHSHQQISPYRISDALALRLVQFARREPLKTAAALRQMEIIPGVTLGDCSTALLHDERVRATINSATKTQRLSNDMKGAHQQLAQMPGAIVIAYIGEEDNMKDNKGRVLQAIVWITKGQLERLLCLTNVQLAIDQTYNVAKAEDGKMYLLDVAYVDKGKVQVGPRALMNHKCAPLHRAVFSRMLTFVRHQNVDPRNLIGSTVMDFDRGQRQGIREALIDHFGEVDGNRLYLNWLRLCTVHMARFGEKHAILFGHERLWKTLFLLLPKTSDPQIHRRIKEMLARDGEITRMEALDVGMSRFDVERLLSSKASIDVNWSRHAKYMNSFDEEVLRAIAPSDDNIRLQVQDSSSNAVEASHQKGSLLSLKSQGTAVRGKTLPETVRTIVLRDLDEDKKYAITQEGGSTSYRPPYSMPGERNSNAFRRLISKRKYTERGTGSSAMSGTCFCKKGDCSSKRCACKKANRDCSDKCGCTSDKCMNRSSHDGSLHPEGPSCDDPVVNDSDDLEGESSQHRAQTLGQTSNGAKRARFSGDGGEAGANCDGDDEDDPSPDLSEELITFLDNPRGFKTERKNPYADTLERLVEFARVECQVDEDASLHLMVSDREGDWTDIQVDQYGRPMLPTPAFVLLLYEGVEKSDDDLPGSDDDDRGGELPLAGVDDAILTSDATLQLEEHGASRSRSCTLCQKDATLNAVECNTCGNVIHWRCCLVYPDTAYRKGLLEYHCDRCKGRSMNDGGRKRKKG